MLSVVGFEGEGGRQKAYSREATGTPVLEAEVGRSSPCYSTPGAAGTWKCHYGDLGLALHQVEIDVEPRILS
jgi:hypothetical protein